jgi:hypothetical protein
MTFHNPTPSEKLDKLQEAYDQSVIDGEPERAQRIKQRIKRYQYGKEW